MATSLTESQSTLEKKPTPVWRTVRYSIYIIATLLLFILGIELIVSTLGNIGEEYIQAIIRATSNPFTSFFIGVIVTAMMQSSSATTAITVAMVASGSLSVPGAVSIIMGANVGTTLTGMIVSLGFINDKKEFRRAVSASACHFLFNFFTLLMVFPIEHFKHALSKLSLDIASAFLDEGSRTASIHVVSPMINAVNALTPALNPFVSLAFGLTAIFSSILLFRRLLSTLLKAKSPESFSRFFFKSKPKSFLWGIITTAAIRSSTITTSVVVPIVAKRITPLKQATPFILGANLGTTITAFFAASLNTANASVMAIAWAHLLFNAAGVIIFLSPVFEKILNSSARGFGKLCVQNKALIVAFILLTFFFIPFLVIYFTQGLFPSID